MGKRKLRETAESSQEGSHGRWLLKSHISLFFIITLFKLFSFILLNYMQ